MFTNFTLSYSLWIIIRSFCNKVPYVQSSNQVPVGKFTNLLVFPIDIILLAHLSFVSVNFHPNNVCP